VVHKGGKVGGKKGKKNHKKSHSFRSSDDKPRKPHKAKKRKKVVHKGGKVGGKKGKKNHKKSHSFRARATTHCGRSDLGCQAIMRCDGDATCESTRRIARTKCEKGDSRCDTVSFRAVDDKPRKPHKAKKRKKVVHKGGKVGGKKKHKKSHSFRSSESDSDSKPRKPHKAKKRKKVVHKGGKVGGKKKHKKSHSFRSSDDKPRKPHKAKKRKKVVHKGGKVGGKKGKKIIKNHHFDHLMTNQENHTKQKKERR